MALTVADKTKAQRIDVRAEGKWWTKLAGTGTLYPSGGVVVYTDITQGQLGNCWYLSSLLSIALRQNGATFLQDRMLDNGDEFVFCSLWDGGKRQHLMKAKKQFALQESGSGAAMKTENSALWVSMFQVFGAAFMSNSFDATKIVYEPKNPNLIRMNSGFPKCALAMLTGKDAVRTAIAGQYNAMLGHHAAGYPMVVQSKQTPVLQGMFPGPGGIALNHTIIKGIVGSHAYAVWEVGTHQFGPVGVDNPPVPAVRLYNPWGSHIKRYTTTTTWQAVTTAGQGDFWIPWTAFEIFFDCVDHVDEALGNAV
ncbi:MAG: hypothetical protein CFE41_17330 [Burkholderiales bacterium PBB2]|nr:MAG: hypothetical protein CFE41_17330 [Burkholderiales bacterium PBB2]